MTINTTCVVPWRARVATLHLVTIFAACSIQAVVLSSIDPQRLHFPSQHIETLRSYQGAKACPI